jgi:hypothetical protein
MKPEEWLRGLMDRGRRRCMHRIMETNGRSCAVLGQVEWVRHHLRRVCLGGDPEGRYRERTGWHGLNSAAAAWRLAARHGVAVVIGLPLGRAGAGQFIYAPRMVGMSMALPAKIEEYVHGCTSSARGDLRRIRREGYVWSWESEMAALPEFLANFHYPSIRGRYGDEGFMLSEEEAGRIRTNPSYALLRIMRGGQWVGGLLVQKFGELLWMRQLGWLAGADQELRAGVSGVGYYASLEWAIKVGARRLVFGAVDPFLEDGLLAYKAKWGGELDAETTSALTLCWAIDPGHPQGRRFFQEHALIAWNAERRFVVFGAQFPKMHSGHRIVGRRLECWYRLLDTPCPAAGRTNRELPMQLRRWFVREQIPVESRRV